MLWLLIFMLVFIVQVVVVLFMEFKNPSKTTAWLLIIFLLPVVGFMLYYLVAREYQKRRLVRRRGKRLQPKLPGGVIHRIEVAMRSRELKNKEAARQKRLFRLLQSIPESPITKCNETEIYSGGKEKFRALKEVLEKARDHIHVEYYTIRADGIGTEIQEILIRKAKEGVEVRVIYDGLGSYDLSGAYVQELTEAGAQVHCFFPLRSAVLARNLNYRNHRKIVVVDGDIGFLGGINIGDEYLGRDPKLGYWRDTHMKLRGDSVYFLQQTFLNDWEFVSGEKLTDERYFPAHGCEGSEQVQIIASGPDAHWDTILEMYFGAINSATDRILIVTPYFIPDPSLQMALKTASLSGVDIQIILPGITDNILVKWASFSYIEELMQAGIRFYLYNKGFVHAKILIVDETIASVGTANMDMRSFYDNFELNAVMFDKKTIDYLVEDFREDLQESTEIRQKEFSKRSRYQRGKEVLARMLSPLL
ncbi:cardiolipin synthase [Paenibacillus aurantius]|uniref:Cardiolipin synthase n=1 Tax=Paenibacillus aurantius TaxID=2918900 RepID=A0AA96LB14_9BACL|nr:cardiolipin synthase [Paenibacillus aurantius]WNQ10509.1 cardiolipin synthase [Paenibacillus aurantius]